MTRGFVLMGARESDPSTNSRDTSNSRWKIISFRSFAYLAGGAIQLFVSPASCSVSVQIKVHCSTRATSFGFERW
jgi:hypothetical protein